MASARHTVRVLAANPAFSAAAVITLALGIGANAAIFSIVDAVALRPPAVRDAGGLVRLFTSTPEGQPYGATSYLELQDIARQSNALDGVVGFAPAVAVTIEEGRVESLLGEVVTGNYFDVLGVPMALGRGFAPDEYATPRTHPVVVLRHGFWQRRFGGDPGVVGRSIRLNGVAFDVIGVAAESYRGQLPGIAAEFWVPAMMIGALMPDAPAALTDRTSRQFLAAARLRDGVDVAAAQSSVAVVAERLAAAYPETNEGHTMTVLPADAVRFHPRLDAVLVPVALLLLSVPALVLLIACTNLAGLLLARGAERRREIAVRLALGAGRRQIVAGLLGESLVLSAVGGALAVPLAWWLLRLLLALRPPLLVQLTLDVAIDHRVVVFAALAATLSGIAFGLAPALRSSRPDLSRALKNETSARGPGRRVSLRDGLIVGQVAVSTLLLLVAGLFVRSLGRAQTIDPGFDTGSSVVLTINAAMRYDEANGRAYFERVLGELGQLPGATSVALADRLPLGLSSQTMQIAPHEPADPGAPGELGEPIDFARVSPGYFRTLGVELIAGRDFDDGDHRDAAPVAIVSAAAARRLWGEQSAVGRQLRRPDRPPLRIVGVARDTRVRTLGEPTRPYLYVPLAQSYESAVEVIVATDGDPAAFLATAQEALVRIDPEVLPLEVMTMADGNDVMLFPMRAAAWAMGAFGLLGTLLSVVGITGTLAYAVAQRRREVGVRAALGATSAQLVAMVVGNSMRRVCAGMTLGVLLALATGRMIEGYLVGVSPADPLAYAAVIALLATSAALASYLPARRAAAADPLLVLRHD